MDEGSGAKEWGEMPQQFLGTLGRKDWEAMAATLVPDLDWHGPRGNWTTRASEYIDTLKSSVGPFEDYQVESLNEVRNPPMVMVELVQRFVVGGQAKVVPEVMVFELSADSGLIRRLSVYWREPDQ